MEHRYFKRRILKQVREQKPLIHCITNYVTVGDVANMILAVGGSPVMADGIREVEDIVRQSQGLVLNIGTLQESVLESMLKAGRAAAMLGIPVVFDPVGAGASAFREQASNRIITEVPCSVIRGNASEISVLMGKQAFSRGVDADDREQVTRENRLERIDAMQVLSRRTKAVVVMTGAQDIVADEERVCMIHNGDPMMSRITGTGCMMNGVIAACLAGSRDQEERFWSTVYATAAEGICGEIAHKKIIQTNGGTGSFRMHFLDAMSILKDEMVWEGARIEI
ncbi:MAG: hydroxyethylthiazole kinase [Lachnospiraceae bacterium]